MKIIFITIASLLISCVIFFTVKFWGQGQTFTEYKHDFFSVDHKPVIFIKPSFNSLEPALKNEKYLYLDVTATVDQKLVIPKVEWGVGEKPINYSQYEEIKDKVVLLADYKTQLLQKKIIFNIYNNTQAIHEIFMFNMKELGLERGANYVVTSPYEAPIKALKELAPALLFATTKPEILKIVAMQGMYLVEAIKIRADIIIHPLKIKNHWFFNAELMQEFNRQYKKIIVGPIDEAEKDEALKLKPFGLILNK